MTTTNNFLEEVLEHIGDYPSMILDQEKKLVSFNDTFLDLFELDKQEIQGKPLPKHINKLITSTHGFFEITKKNR